MEPQVLTLLNARTALRPVTTRVRTMDGVYHEKISEGTVNIENAKKKRDILGGSYYYELPHVQQTQKWDCGLCCMSMILGHIKRVNSDLESLKKLHLGTVVWTVNLAYMLKDFGMKCTFYTKEKQISANYETDIFSLQQDAPEVETFHKALALAKDRVHQADINGVLIEERELTSQELKDRISSGHVAIILINSLIFACLECQHELFNEDTYCTLPFTGTPYRGHYIVICGYNPKEDIYIFKNPSADCSFCYIPSSLIEQSRKSFGTQQNIILVELSNEGHRIRPK